MTLETADTRISATTSRAGGLGALRVAAVVIAAACLLPLLAVVAAAALGTTETFAHLLDTVLWRYLATTALLVVSVAIGVFLIGTGAGWLIAMTEFPGRRAVEVLLILPLAFPAYVLAYAYTHILDHPGIVQTTLRDLTGWGPRDYWFPEVRSTGGAALMLILVLYPYVYLLARAAFLNQSAAPFIAARTLGRSAIGAFAAVSLPMARPALAAGTLLAVMETIADFGTVSYFGVQTFATGIYASWFSMADRGAAAQLALCLLIFALVLVALERTTRGGARFDHGRSAVAHARIHLRGRRAVLALALCAAPIVFGVILPVIALAVMGMESEQSLLSPRYLGFLWNTVILAGTAAALTVVAAIALSYLGRLRPGPAAGGALSIGRLGYAVPGGVIAVGLLVPFAALDNAFDAFMEARFGIDTGLILTGTIAALILAYMIRFLAAALSAVESGLGGINANMDAAARVLGDGPYRAFARVHLPILAPSVLTAALIVFVDVMKELPATLIMRPFNFDTLAVQAHRLAADERLEGAAVPSLVIVAAGLIPVLLLSRRVGGIRKAGQRD
ncbi:MAG: iron ABC transporter permease [Pseudomonadota bacterium]